MSVYLSPTDHHELVGRDVPVVGTAYCERCGRVERTRVHLDGCGEFVFVPESCGRPEQLVLF